MRRNIVALFAFILPASSVSQSIAQNAQIAQQAAGISAKYDNAPMNVVLNDVAKRGGVRITYTKAVVERAGNVTAAIDNATLSETFGQILKGTGLRAVKVTSDAWTVVREEASSRRAVGQGVIAGKVMDGKSNKGVYGANVSLGNSTHGTVTSEDGSYRLTGISAGIHTVTVRLVGYAKQIRSVTVSEGAAVTADFKLEPSANVLDQVVVTGTVVQSELRSVPNAISVITAKDIQERGIIRIDQLFRGDIPGLFSLNMGSNAVYDEVTMFSRGATALSGYSAGIDNKTQNTNSIKTYIDGVEMSDSKYLSQIDPTSIERIEILTGPQASTIYGSNAINGVMQIFTKRGASSRPRLALSITGGVAENNFSSHTAPSYVTDAGLTGTEGKFSYNVGGSWNYQGSWTPGKQAQRISAYGGGRMDIGKLTADVSSRHGLTRSKQNGNVLQSETELRASGIWSPDVFASLPNPQTYTLNGRTLGFSLSYRPLSWWSHEVVLGSDASITERMETAPGFSFDGGSNGSDTALFIGSTTTARRSERYSNTMQLPISSFAKVNLTFGADHWRVTGSSWSAFPVSLTGSFPSPSIRRNKPDKNSGAYLQGQLGLSDELFFTYGVRADWNPSFGDRVKANPGRYGVSYTREVGPLSAKLRGSYGKSIRPPAPRLALGQTAASIGFGSSVISQFGNFDYIKANPDLGPEHQSGGEGGIELYLGNSGSLVVTRFNQTVDNLITTVFRADSVSSLLPVFPSTTNCDTDVNGIRPYDADGRCFRYQEQYLNVGSVRNQGWELQGTANLGPFTTRGTYSWVKSRVIGITPKYRALVQGSSFQLGRSFDYLPEHTWALSIAYAYERNTISLSVNGVGMRYVAGNSLSLAASGNSRFQLMRARMQSLSTIYRPIGSGYAMADLNATHRFSPRIDASLQITNLADYYQNDYNASYASAGRSSRVGFRLRW